MFCKAFHIFISYVTSNIDVTAEEEQNINKKHNEKVEWQNQNLQGKLIDL